MKLKYYELMPKDGRKIFYGKAHVIVEDGAATLYSYETKILTVTGDEMTRHWDGWSQTTGRHIFAFAGLRKAEYEDLPLGVPTQIKAR